MTTPQQYPPYPPPPQQPNQSYPPVGAPPPPAPYGAPPQPYGQPQPYAQPYAQPQPAAPQAYAGFQGSQAPPVPPAPANPYATPPQAGWGQPPAPQAPYPGAGQIAGGPGGTSCQLCGAQPAAQVTIRGHQGMIVMMRFLRRRGVFCRTCGTAVYRDMNAQTLVRGWWGYASCVITPITLLINFFNARVKLNRLPWPTMPGWGPPRDMGRPVLLRPAALMLLLPVLLVVLIIVAAASGGGSDTTDDYGSTGAAATVHQVTQL